MSRRNGIRPSLDAGPCYARPTSDLQSDAPLFSTNNVLAIGSSVVCFVKDVSRSVRRLVELAGVAHDPRRCRLCPLRDSHEAYGPLAAVVEEEQEPARNWNHQRNWQSQVQRLAAVESPAMTTGKRSDATSPTRIIKGLALTEATIIHSARRGTSMLPPRLDAHRESCQRRANTIGLGSELSASDIVNFCSGDAPSRERPGAGIVRDYGF